MRVISLAILAFLFITGFKTESNSVKIGSADSTQYVLYIFTGSDWCANCKRLDKNVLQDSSFQKLLKEQNIQTVILDFPQKKKLSPSTIKYNETISEKFGFQGNFPTLILNSNVSGKYITIYYKNETAQEFATQIRSELLKIK